MTNRVRTRQGLTLRIILRGKDASSLTWRAERFYFSLFLSPQESPANFRKIMTFLARWGRSAVVSRIAIRKGDWISRFEEERARFFRCDLMRIIIVSDEAARYTNVRVSRERRLGGWMSGGRECEVGAEEEDVERPDRRRSCYYVAGELAICVCRKRWKQTSFSCPYHKVLAASLATTTSPVAKSCVSKSMLPGVSRRHGKICASSRTKSKCSRDVSVRRLCAIFI